MKIITSLDIPYVPQVEKITRAMSQGQGEGSDFLGWLSYPRDVFEDVLQRESEYGRSLREYRHVFCLGIGGSYLGAKAAISALRPRDQRVKFYGNSLSASELKEGLDLYDPRKDHVVVISKSGTTMETAIALRLFLHKALEESEAIIKTGFTAITDEFQGSLHDFALEHEIPSFVVPQDMGGRYSVLSPVGRIPMEAAGIDTVALIRGARNMMEDIEASPAVDYALLRHHLRQRGKMTEIFATFEPRLRDFGAWWQQLFGESEGKGEGAILPVPLTYSTDLHSMGQWVQEGPRNIFETVLTLEGPGTELKIPVLSLEDGLKALEGRSLDHINEVAKEGTLAAHRDGGLPVLELVAAPLREEVMGELFYFFQYACAVSAYLQGVNPFDQPGVEAYKSAMRERL
ncbi:MAG: glucose-6-phosphate isomerase [Tissierellia bacterium]|nr:glucose-6-phosphate isomerase [Tissierellia bacterium]